MNHSQLKELIHPLYDGEISPSDKKLIKDHLFSCGECRQELANWKKISSILFQKTVIHNNPFFTQKVMHALQEEKISTEDRSLWKWLVPSFGFGFAALLLFLSYSPTTSIVSADDILLINGVAAESVSVEDFIDYEGGSDL